VVPWLGRRSSAVDPGLSVSVSDSAYPRDPDRALIEFAEALS
jgi:hypothetical protein